MSNNRRIFAINKKIQSELSDSTAAIHYNGECVLFGVMIGTDGTNDVTINVYDGIDDTGDVAYTPNIKIQGSAGLVYISPESILMTTGIFITAEVDNDGVCYHRAYYDK